LVISQKERIKLLEYQHPDISIKRQTELLGINRSRIYYKGSPQLPKNKDQEIYQLIQDIHLKHIFYGARKIKKGIQEMGYAVNIKKIRRIMSELNIQPVYTKPKTSIPNIQNKKYPYLLKNVQITRINHVWSSDITYLKIKNGWVYLTVIMDWYSRYVISWGISITLSDNFCINALKTALNHGVPEIFNTDQGSQYTSTGFTSVLENYNIKISMDGKGRCLDNIFTERLWRSLKYENIYLKDYDTVAEVYMGLKEYFEFYNNERFHQAINYQTPAQVFLNK